MSAVESWIYIWYLFGLFMIYIFVFMIYVISFNFIQFGRRLFSADRSSSLKESSRRQSIFSGSFFFLLLKLPTLLWRWFLDETPVRPPRTLIRFLKYSPWRLTCHCLYYYSSVSWIRVYTSQPPRPQMWTPVKTLAASTRRFYIQKIYLFK